MGSPKKPKKKYSTPSHPWQKVRIEEEKELLKEYGLKNKKEIWKATSILRKFKNQAKDLIASRGEQADKQKELFLNKLNRLNMIQKTDLLDAVLGLGIRDILNRRLQTVVLNKGLARSTKQARQFITHEHIIVGDKKVTKPSFMVGIAEENQLSFITSSTLANAEHPERSTQKKPEEIEKEVKEKEIAKKEKKVEVKEKSGLKEKNKKTKEDQSEFEKGKSEEVKK
jgi:small subunit ribosomal protein S4